MNKDCITLDELKKLFDEIINKKDSGQAHVTVDGIAYRTDIDYAFDGIEMFIDIIDRRCGGRGYKHEGGY